MGASWNHRVPLGFHGGLGLMRRSRRWSWSSRRTRSSCRIPLHLQGTEENSKAFLSVDPPKKDRFQTYFCYYTIKIPCRGVVWCGIWEMLVRSIPTGSIFRNRLPEFTEHSRWAPGLFVPTAWWILPKSWNMTLNDGLLFPGDRIWFIPKPPASVFYIKSNKPKLII